MLEAPSSTLALRNQLRLSRPGSYYFGAGGGLGFGLAAAVGVQLAQPEPAGRLRRSARARSSTRSPPSGAPSPTTCRSPSCVLRNSEYAILKWFAAIEGVEGAPGLDLPGLDTAAIAAGYGVGAVTRRAAPTSCARRSPARSPPTRPELVEVGVAPGMWLF